MKNVKKGFSLSEDEKKFLVETRKKLTGYENAALRCRIKGILLVGEGVLNEEAARICKVNVRTLRRWLASWRKYGFEGLKHKKGAGKPHCLSSEKKEQLVEIIKSGPEAAGLETGIWTASLVRELILEKFGVRYSVSNVQKILRDLKLSYKLPQKNSPEETRNCNSGGWM